MLIISCHRLEKKGFEAAGAFGSACMGARAGLPAEGQGSSAPTGTAGRHLRALAAGAATVLPAVSQPGREEGH